MDPNTTLTELRELLANHPDDERPLELLDALGDWLARGGFLPELWRPAATTDPAPTVRPN